ncbi:MAG TPA: NIPSNAP family protein [Gaiellaceae bacterium]|nr:NIPSNAP family protein [Gaiellaceae bacterium]HET8653306.1 NIPSNAP family protein [Gaiellaceae bacterium]
MYGQAQASTGRSPIVELRQYALLPGRRDELIDLFDSTFVESQEAVGIDVIGQFRDLDHPDRFVWLRGFPSMDARRRSLTDFYSGPVWRAHRDAANATMVDCENVLLLRPARSDSTFRLGGSFRRALGGDGRGVVEAAIFNLEAGDEAASALTCIDEAVLPAVAESGGSILGCYLTEASENTFPALPVREGENVLVWFAGFADGSGAEHVWRSSQAVSRAVRKLEPTRPPQALRLAPTSRSLLDGDSPACLALPPEAARAL